jgi:hypothetical protein
MKQWTGHREIASKEGLDLEAVTQENLKRLQSRLLPGDEGNGERPPDRRLS